MGSDDPETEPPFLHHKSKYDLNSKIMLTAIISLSLVALAVTILHIYARCIIRRQARRRAALGQLRINIAATAQVHSSSEPPKRGLDPSVIASLPTFVFNHVNNNINNVEMGSIECSVCLSNLEDGEMTKTLPNCRHVFHAECIDRWLGSESTCPICRTQAEPREAAIAPTAPPLDCETSASMEGTSSDGNGMQSSAKVNGLTSSPRLSSFRRILSRERSSRRIQPSGQREDCSEDLERQ